MSNELLQQILSEIKNIHKSIDRLEEGQDKLKADIQVLKEGQDKLKVDVQVLKEGQDKLKVDIQVLKEGQEIIKNQVDEFEVKNANNHFEILSKVDSVSKDIRFIKHKEYQNEQELFTIKDHLKIIK